MFTSEDIDRLPYRRGPFTSIIAFVGEAPGEQEEHDEYKRPFIGAAGQLLEAMLINAGIDPTQVYFTNVIKERPDDHDVHKWIKRNRDVFDLHVNVLHTELASLPNLQMIVPVGGVALQTLCGKPSIENWRGSVIPCTLRKLEGKKCLPIIHTAAILRNWLDKPATVLDIQRIKKEMTFPEIRRPIRNPILRPSFEQIFDYINFLKTSSCLISVDLETLPHPQRIVSTQLSHSPQEGMAILFQHRDGRNVWSEDQELLIWKALINLLENCGKRIIGQNILTFDLFMLNVFGARLDKLLANVYLDTMEAFQCLQPQLPRGLDFLTSVYTEEPYYKSEGKEWGTKQGEDEFLMYGCKDVMVVSEIAPQLYKELEEENLLDFYYKHFQGRAKARLKMSRRGLLRDEAKRADLDRRFGGSILREQCHLTILAGKNVNVKSGPQMQKLLYEEMKLPKQWSKQGTVTCDENALLTLSAKYPSEVFKHILSIRQMRTLYSNNIKSRTDSDGRIRCSFGFAETGRFRSFECPLGSGGNLQNWTPSMRVMIVPDKGKVFVEGDSSQAEARVVAWAGHIKYMIDTFMQGKDIHSQTASLIFDVALEKITKKSPERYAAKKIVHACDYDMHAATFAKAYNKDAAEMGYPLISIGDAAKLLALYHEKVPELRGNYHKWIEEQLRATKTLTNPFGRRMIFHDRIGNDLFRAGYAYYAQSTVADVINEVLEGTVNEELDVLLQVHDSILIQCNPNEVTAVINLMKSLNPTIEVGGMPLTIPMEFKVSDTTWKDMRDFVEEKAA